MKLFSPPALMKFLAFCVVGLFSALSVSAQDVITLKTGEKIDVKIVEVNETEIKYREYRDPDGIIFTMSRGMIREVRYESGRREEQVQPGLDEAYYVDDRRNNIKLNFLALGGDEGHTILTYERALNPKSSVEGVLKINGLGFNNDLGKSGVGLDVGYKLKLGSLFKKRGDYRPKHMLAGSFFRPVLGFNTASFDRGYYESYTYAHFGLDLGGQWIIQNIVSIELFGGWHYYGGSFNSRNGNDIFFDEFYDGNLFATGENSAFSFGLNVGVLFGKEKAQGKRKRR